MPKALDDAPWSSSAQFVVGLDIGTAHSSVTFSHLERGKMPQNHRVTHWPAATGAGGSSDAKTASMLYYDGNNNLKATGAAVTSPTMRHNAKINNWHLVRYFKLLLHPPTMIKEQDFQKFHFEALPNGLNVEQVYADMIRYMLSHTRDFLEQRNGTGKWQQLKPLMTLVIAHPNGWGLREQERLRAAVVVSGFMSESDVKQKVKFVSEAEAAVHYILWEKSQELQPGDKFIVCDAGGSTVDTTAYRVEEALEEVKPSNNNFGPPPNPPPHRKKGTFRSLFRKKSKTRPKVTAPVVYEASPKPAIHLREIKASDCQPAGGVFVNEALVGYLRNRFYDLPPDQAERVEQCIQKAEESFEVSCKREFDVGGGAPSEYVVELGMGIPGYMEGSLLLDAETVQGFFEEPVNRIIESIEKQIRGMNPQYIFLVGGFGTCKYLRQRVSKTFERRGLQVLFLDDAHGKAASDGSIIWFIRKGVTARAARMSFGLKVHDPYNSSLPEHRARSQVILANGIAHVDGKWAMIAAKDKVFDEKSSSKKTYIRSYSSPNPDLDRFTVELFAWTNDIASPPQWIIDPEGYVIDGYEVVCEIEADMSGLKGGLTKKRGQRGDYWVIEFDVCIEFGGTELTAHLEWKEKGMTKRSEASILVTSS